MGYMSPGPMFNIVLTHINPLIVFGSNNPNPQTLTLDLGSKTLETEDPVREHNMGTYCMLRT